MMNKMTTIHEDKKFVGIGLFLKRSLKEPIVNLVVKFIPKNTYLFML